MSSIPPETTIRYILGAIGALEGLVSEDEILDAILVYPTDWRLAAAFIADSLASRAINDPESFGLTGVMNVGWGDRAGGWSRLAARLRTQVAEESGTSAPGQIQTVMLKREFLSAEPEEYSRPRRDRGRFDHGID